MKQQKSQARAFVPSQIGMGLETRKCALTEAHLKIVGIIQSLAAIAIAVLCSHAHG
jgi:hypothetical protein